MHPNPIFRGASKEKNSAFARKRGFGMLTVNGEHGPLLSHIPFVLSDDAARLEAHLVRSNPIVASLKHGSLDAVIAVTGGDAYISPDWYGIEDEVPTWNYVAVHLRGKLELLPDDELHGILERTSAHFEKELAPKRPWTIGKMNEDVYARMQRQIVPICLGDITIDGTWKLSQNKADEVALSATRGVSGGTVGQETASISDLMVKAIGEPK